jgi:hypothetical protein
MRTTHGTIRRTLNAVRTNVLLPGLVGILLAACGGDKSPSGPADNDSGGPEPGGYVPGSVVGNWKFGTISMLSFWDDHTGDYIGTASGVAVFFIFAPDGRFTELVYVLARNYGCVTQTWTEMEGTVNFGSDTFDAAPKSGRYRASDSCIERNNFERPMNVDELAGAHRTFLWRFETNPNDGKTYLMVGHDADTWSSFERTE